MESQSASLIHFPPKQSNIELLTPSISKVNLSITDTVGVILNFSAKIKDPTKAT